MPDTKITALAAITTVDPAADVLPIVDISDTSMAASGTTKKITSNQILGAGGTATLASATITGDLGVGTASPSTKLEVATATANTRLRINSTSVVATEYFRSGTGLWLVGSDSTNAFKIARGSNFGGSADYFSIGSATADCTWFDTAGGTRMTLNATGLGVGKSPAQKLDVNGTIQTSGYVFFTTPSASIGAGTSNSSWLEINSGTNFNIRVNGGDRFLVDTSGNVGIGVTPSAWGATAKAIQIGSYSGIYNDVDFTVVVNNAFFNGTNNIYRNTAPASQYYQQAGSHVWRTAPSGTAGNTITGANAFVQTMTLDASGRLILLASTTTPATLATNGQLTFTATSNTNLRFSYRGSDGVTRTADLTLA